MQRTAENHDSSDWTPRDRGMMSCVLHGMKLRVNWTRKTIVAVVDASAIGGPVLSQPQPDEHAARSWCQRWAGYIASNLMREQSATQEILRGMPSVSFVGASFE